MKSRTRTLSLPLLALAVCLLWACEAANTTPAGGTGGDDEAFTYASFALEAENGGFDADSSMDPFEEVDGDDMGPWLDDADEEDVAADPSVNPPADVPDDDALRGKTVYHVRILWGQPFPNRNVTESTDWSGSVSSSVALLKLRRVLRFERRGGDAILPREDARRISFESHTLPHNDGLLLSVVLPDASTDGADPAGADLAPTLSIDLGPVSLTYDIAALDGLSDLQIVDDLGNVVSVTAVLATRPEACAQGVVDGYWKRLNRRGGVFGGRWINADGEHAGHVAGIWGRRKGGRRAMFGVIRGTDGGFLGLVRGTYTPYGAAPHAEPGEPMADGAVEDAPETQAGGLFAARWVGADRTHRGVVRGRYTGDGDGEGEFHGNWAKACRERPADAGVPGTETGCEGDGCETALPSTGPEDAPRAQDAAR